MKMILLQGLRAQVENEIINNACKDVEPENMLTKTYIVDTFLEFIKKPGVDDENYYLEWYGKEYNKNENLNKNDFIYHTVLGIQKDKDVSKEYSHLVKSASKYKSTLQEKKEQFVKELQKIGEDKKKFKNKYDKIVFYKQIIEEELKKNEYFEKKNLIKRAWQNCRTLHNKVWPRDFEQKICWAKNVGTDERYLIYFGHLSVREIEVMIDLKKKDREKYSELFESKIYRSDIIKEVNRIAKDNFYIQNRLELISSSLSLFEGKQYMSFVYLVTPQIEGLFRIWQHEILGDRSQTKGIRELMKKIYENDDFFAYTYFAYDFPEVRNPIGHGDIIKVDRELACEIMMDLYWILNIIDSEDCDYKKWMSFLKDFCSKQDAKEMVECLKEYFTSFKSEKYLDLLERHLEGKLDPILEWYGFGERQKKFNESIHSEELYLGIWNDDPLEVETIERRGEEDETTKMINDNSLKYSQLLELLNKQKCIPDQWYKKYLSFTEQIDAIYREYMKNTEINFEGIEEELE